MAETIDRYGLSAFFSFEQKGDALGQIAKVEGGLRSLERTVSQVQKTVHGATIAQDLRAQFNGGEQVVGRATNAIAHFGKSASATASHLSPLRAEFRALRAESRNIDFGDLSDPNQFRAARDQLKQYTSDLRALEQQITGNTTAERQFKAELIRAQSIASDKGLIAESQRNSAIAAERAGKATAIAGAGAAIALPGISAGKAAIDITSSFDDQISAVEAVLAEQDRTAANMDALREKAKQIGASTKFSASDAASGLVLLAQSGQSVNEQLKSIEGTTLLAAAGGLDLAAATDITVAALGQFSLGADQAVHVANVLAYNAGAANLGVADLGESLKYAGPAAAKFGASLDETSALLDVFSEIGVKGSAAGTALRTIFLNLASPTNEAQRYLDRYGISLKDAAGNMRPTIDIMEQLQAKLGGLSSGEKLDAVSSIFGKEATPAALAIVGGGADKMKNYLRGGANQDTVRGKGGAVGSAAVQAGIMEDNIGGSFRNLSSAIEGLQIEIGEVLTPIVRTAADALSGFIAGIIALPKPIKQGVVMAGLLVTGLASLAAIVGTASAAFFTLQSAIGASSVASTVMQTGLIPLTGFAQTAITGFGANGLAGAFTALSGSVMGFAGGALAALTSPLSLAIAGALALYAVVEQLTPSFNVLGGVLSAIAAPLGFVWGLATGIASGIKTAITPILEQFASIKVAGLGIGEALAIAADTFKRFAGIGEVVGQSVGLVLGVVIGVPLRGLIALFGVLSDAIGFVGTLGEALATPFTLAVTTIQNAWQGFVDWFMAMPLVTFARDLGMGLINALNHNPTVKIPIAWDGAIAKITGLFSDLLGSGRDTATALTQLLNPTAIAQNIAAGIQSFVGMMQSIGVGLWSMFTSPFSGMIASAQNAVSGLGTLWQSFAGWLSGSLMAIPAMVSDAFSKIIPPFLKDKVQAPTPTQQASAAPALATFIAPQIDIAKLQSMESDYLAQIGAMGMKGSKVLQSSFAFDGTQVAAKTEPMVSSLSAMLAVAKDGLHSMTNSVLIFGATTLAAMSPLILGLGAIAFGVVAISTNLLGLRTIVTGLIQVMKGVATAVHGVWESISGVLQIARSVVVGVVNLFQAIPSALRGDFTAIKIAFQAMNEGIGAGFRLFGRGLERIGLGFKTTFVGMQRIGKGFGEALRQIFVTFPRMVGGSIEMAGKVWRTGVELMRGIPFAIGLEQIQSLPGKVSSVFEKSTAFVRSAVEGIQEKWSQLHPIFPAINMQRLGGVSSTISGVVERVRSIWASLALLFPQINLSAVEKIQGVITGVVERVHSIWQGLSLPFPRPSLNPIESLPMAIGGIVEKVGAIWQGFSLPLPHLNLSAIESFPAVISGIAERVGGIWQGLTQTFNTPIFERVTGFARALPEVFEAAIAKITALWAGLSEKFGGILGGMVEKSKGIGQRLVAFLSENSPGPTFQIRAKWSSTITHVRSEIETLSASAKIQGERIAGSLSGKSFHGLGRSASSLGMVMSNISPSLAMPLFAINDVIDAADALSESLPQAKKFFTGLAPEAVKFKGVLGSFKSTFISVASSALPLLTSIGSAIVSFASTAITAITPIVLPFLPIVATIGALVGAIALLKVAFDSNFLGIRSLLDFALAPLFAIPRAIGAAKNMILGSQKEPSIQASNPYKPRSAGDISSFLTQAPNLSQAIPQAANPEALAIPSIQPTQRVEVGAPSAILGNSNTIAEKPPAESILQSIVPESASQVSRAWNFLAGKISNTLSTLKESATQILPAIADQVQSHIEKSVNGIAVVLNSAMDGFTSATNSVVVFAAAALASISPLGLAIGAVGLGALAIATNFLGVRSIVAGLIQVAKGLTSAIHGVGEAISGISQIARASISGVISLLQSIPSALRGDFSLIQGSFLAMSEGIKEGASTLLQGFERVGSGVKTIFNGLAQVVAGFGEAFTQIIQSITNTWQMGTEVFRFPFLEKVSEFARALPEVFEVAIAKITALWTGLSEKFGGILGGMLEKSKGIGQRLVAFLSENSPGPTFQIRAKWSSTVTHVRSEIENLSASAKIQGERIAGDLSGKSFHGLGRSASSLGMALSNISPSLAMPLFAINDVIDAADTLSESLPQAKKFFTGLAPEAVKFKGVLGGVGSGLMSVVGSALPLLGTLGSAVVGLASTAIAAITPIILPFLPIIATIGAVAGAIALLKVAFDSNFLGIRSLLDFAFAPLFAIPRAIGAVKGLLGVGFKKEPSLQASNPYEGSVSAETLESTSLIAPVQSDPIYIDGPSIATDQIQKAWTGFGSWFGGAMDGMVGVGQAAGEGLVNALNHNPTVRIPIAWHGATTRIETMLHGWQQFGAGVGEGLVATFKSASAAVSDALRAMGLSGLLSLAPLLPVIAGVGVGFWLISQNILGIGTMARGVFQGVYGVFQGIGIAVGGVNQIFKGLGYLFQGLLSGDLSVVSIGVSRVFTGLRVIIEGFGLAVQRIFYGLSNVVRGVFQAFGTGGEQAFERLSNTVTAIGFAIKNALSSPAAAWQGFLSLIESIELKIRGIGSAIANSPVAAFFGGAKAKITGDAATLESGVAGARFDQKVAALTPTPSPTPIVAPAIKGAVEAQLPNFKNGLNSASESVGALGTILGTIAPAAAGPLNAIGGLLSSVLTLSAAVPVLTGWISGLGASFAAAGGFAGLLTMASGALTAGFSAVGIAAAGAWTAITGPLLPIIAAVGLVSAAVGALYLAFNSNFLGIQSLFSAIFDGVREILGGVVDQWQRTVGGILKQVAILGVTITKPFAPLLTLFGQGGGLGSALGLLVDGLLLPFRILATAIGFVVGTIGKLVEAAIIFGSVLTEIIMQPVGAVVSSVVGIAGALGGLFSAITTPFQGLVDTWNKLTGAIQGAGAESETFGNIIRAISNVVLMPLRIVFAGISIAIAGIGLAVELVIGSFTLMAKIILAPISAISALIQGITFLGGIIGQALVTPLDYLSTVFNGFISSLTTLPSLVLSPFEVIGSLISGFINALMTIPGLLGGLSSLPIVGGLFSAIAPQPQQPVQFFASGGPVAGIGSGDTAPAMLTPNEFVLRPAAAQSLGLPLLEAINSGGLSALMELVPIPPPLLVPQPVMVPESGGNSSGPVQFTFSVGNITIAAPQGTTAESGRVMALEILDQLAPHLDRFISDALRSKVERAR